MKKLLFSFLLLLTTVVCRAEDFEVDGIYYNITSAEELTVEVTSGSTKYSGDVAIPESVVYDGVTYSVTAIGDNAFYYCRSLISVLIPNSVTTIGSYAFDNCRSLTSVTIPNSVTTIGYGAFEYCSGLTSIDIPNSVTEISERAFRGCSGLESVVVTSGNPIYDSRDNCNAIVETSSNNLILGCKNTVIPNSVTTIGGYAFYNCSGLTSIIIPNSVTTIGGYAFEYCSGLTSVTIPNSVTTIGGYAFYNCSGLTSITIPNSVTTIETAVFEYCSGLTSVTIPNSVTTIGGYAFCNCSGLTSIIIPNSVTTIGDGAFFGCSGLESVVVTKGNPVYDSRDNCNAIVETSSNKLIFGCKNTVIPNSVTMIGRDAFNKCSGLTSIIIPNSVTTIGSYAFSNCSGLESIIVTNGNPIYDSRDNSNAIIETSSNKLIFGCKNTVIPNSVTMIGEYAFYRCSGLISLTIPNSVTTIGINAFEYSGLTSVTIPNSVTEIGEGAFYGCSGLTSISIGNKVKKISYAAFGDCTALQDVYCLAESVPSTAYSAFEDVKLSSATLHVPAASLEDYSTTSPWSKFGQIVAIGEGDGIEQLTVEEEGNSAFKNPAVYDLSGQRVSKPRKGIYVINGRKTLVK